MNYNLFSLFNHFFLAKTPEEAVFVFEVTCSHAFPPPTAGCFPHYKAGAGGWGPAARQYPSSSTDPPNTGIPRTGPYHPTLHPNPPSSLLSPIFRISSKADVAKSASSRYNKIHILFKASYIVENTQQTVSSDKVSWQIWLLAYIPRGLALASRSWGRLIQNPPKTLFMAQFCTRKWVLNIFDICCLLWQQGSCVTHENYQSIQLITQHLPVDQEKVDTI